MAKPRQLGLLPLVASTFFMVSGGAYGLEELVGCGYPVAMATLVATPLVWSLPTALMVGELASALPRQGGYYAWVRRALGPFWGFQEAWLSLVASVFDMAIYPALFTLYVGRLAPSIAAGRGALVAGLLVIAISAAWNLCGAGSVGRGSVALGLAVLAPFAVFALLAPWHGHRPDNAAPSATPPAAGLLTGLLIAMWNYMGWDYASTIAEDVQRPERVYPRAVLAALGLVSLTYLVPVGAAALAGVDPSGWTTGAWVDAARQIGGRSLALAMVAGAIVCSVGMYNALLLSYSQVPAALAEDGYLPRWLSRRRASGGAPWASILVCSLTYAACLGLDFRRLVEEDILLYGASLLLEFVALVALRIREPALERPFRVPGGTLGAAALGLGPLVVLGVALVRCEDQPLGPVSSLGLGAILVALGPILYWSRRRRRRPEPAP